MFLFRIRKKAKTSKTPLLWNIYFSFPAFAYSDSMQETELCFIVN